MPSRKGPGIAPAIPKAVVNEVENDQASKQHSAKKLFKYVSGVLNGAFPVSNVASCICEIRMWMESSAESEPSFEMACEALAIAIVDGFVPAQGVDVLTSLATGSNMKQECLPLPSSLANALKLPTREDSKSDVGDDADSIARTSVGVELDNPDSSDEDHDTQSREQADHTAIIDQTPGVCNASCDSAGASVQPTPKPRSRTNLIFRYVVTVLTGGKPDFSQEADVRFFLMDTPQQDSQCGGLISGASRLLAKSIDAGEVPQQGISVLFREFSKIGEQGLCDLEESLKAYMCPACEEKPLLSTSCGTCKDARQVPCVKCSGSGRFAPICRSCNGTSRGNTRKHCLGCNGSGKKDLGSCNSCQGTGSSPCQHCCSEPRVGKPRPLCDGCVAARRAQAVARMAPRSFPDKRQERPEPGMTVEKCGASELTRLKQLWSNRGGSGEVIEAWKVDNPLRAHCFRERREELKRELGREADGLEGFHGTHPDAVIPICETGFDKTRRSGQVYGAGEYFAKNPTVSIGYCKGGEYMLVCRLTLGHESSTPQNKDGDHIWVSSTGYYVVKEPEQVLPQYIIKFAGSSCYGYGSHIRSSKLEGILEQGKWSTKVDAEIKPVPRQRDCLMSRDTTTVLWMGFFHGHLSDEQLKLDVVNFLHKFAREYMDGARIQIVKGHFKKAHAILNKPIPRDLVHKLNRCRFIEDGEARTICVEDGHGSPGQKCPKFIAGYCRGQNLRFTHPCWCDHPPRPTAKATFTLTPIELDSAKGVELIEKFMASAPFHTGNPTVVNINAIHNETLARCHDEYRAYLATKHMEEPAVQELYHGTNNKILDILYQHGLQPPSDTQASEKCPKSGGKGLCTTLCNNSCVHCTQKHEWDRCHMYGLGIYLADMAQKSHRYVSQPEVNKSGRQTYRMVVCSVLGKCCQVEGHLKTKDAMHDVVNLRALAEDDMDAMIERCQACSSRWGVGASIQGVDGDAWGRVVADMGHAWRLSNNRIAKKETEGWKWNWAPEVACENLEVPEKSDILFVKGLGSAVRQGWSVVNSEYIAFHPHQCLPKYEIEYWIR
jgi:hypothetical protein